MLIISKTGIPALVCDRDYEPVPIDSAVVMKHEDLISVTIVCIDCAEKLKEMYPRSNFIPAREYLETILTVGRPKRIVYSSS